MFDDDFLAMDGAGELNNLNLAEELNLGEAWGATPLNVDTLNFGEVAEQIRDDFDFSNIMADSTNIRPIPEDRDSLPPSGELGISERVSDQGRTGEQVEDAAKGKLPQRGAKRMRPLVDVRIELTDDELKVRHIPTSRLLFLIKTIRTLAQIISKHKTALGARYCRRSLRRRVVG